MKKWIAISMLSVYLISTTELYQLLKLPFFVEHFIEHKALNNDLTLWGFMCLHYFGDDLNDNDNDKDMQLPFKSYDGHISLNILAFLTEPLSHISLITKITPFQLKTGVLYEKVFVSSTYSSSVWQPPKSC